MVIPIINKRVDDKSFLYGMGASLALMVLPVVSEYVLPFVAGIRDKIGGNKK